MLRLAGGLRALHALPAALLFKKTKKKAKSLLATLLPLFNWEGVAVPFFEIIWNGVAPIIVNYGYIHVHRAQSAVRGALTPFQMISKNNKKRGYSITS